MSGIGLVGQGFGNPKSGHIAIRTLTASFCTPTSGPKYPSRGVK